MVFASIMEEKDPTRNFKVTITEAEEQPRKIVIETTTKEVQPAREITIIQETE